MKELNSGKDQSHPLYLSDRDHLDRMLAKDSPEDKDIVDLARLLLRYQGFPGAADLQADMVKTLALWGISHQDLNDKARELWSNGYRPGKASSEKVGSGFDTAESEEK